MRVSWFDETANFTRLGHIHLHVIWLLAGFLFENMIKLFVLKLQPMALAFCSPQNVQNEVKIHNNDLLNILSFLSFLFCKPLGDRQFTIMTSWIVFNFSHSYFANLQVIGSVKTADPCPDNQTIPVLFNFLDHFVWKIMKIKCSTIRKY